MSPFKKFFHLIIFQPHFAGSSLPNKACLYHMLCCNPEQNKSKTQPLPTSLVNHLSLLNHTNLRAGEAGRTCTKMKPMLCRYCMYCWRKAWQSSSSQASSLDRHGSPSAESQLWLRSLPDAVESLERWRFWMGANNQTIIFFSREKLNVRNVITLQWYLGFSLCSEPTKRLIIRRESDHINSALTCYRV